MLWLGITSITSAQPSVVDANHYDAFWLWAESNRSLRSRTPALSICSMQR